MITIKLDDLPSVPYRNHMRHRLSGNWLRRLWWMRIAERVMPKLYEREMLQLWTAEKLVKQELVDAVITRAMECKCGDCECKVDIRRRIGQNALDHAVGALRAQPADSVTVAQTVNVSIGSNPKGVENGDNRCTVWHRNSSP